MSEYCYGARIIHFTMESRKYVINSPKSLSKDELEAMLFHVRRMLGYIVYPRWFLLELYFSEVVEMLKKNNMYRHEIKKAVKNILTALDELDRKHRKGFDNDFLEVMAGSLSGKSLSKINDIRGSIGGVLMNYGIKNYLLYSYPYAFVNLCYDNMLTYDFALRQVKQQYDIDLSQIFTELRGDKVYIKAITLMTTIIKVLGESIERLSFKDSNCLAKIEALNNIMSNEDNIRNAFKEAFNEIPDDKRKHLKEGMSLWKEESDDFANTLAQKYNVKRKTK